MIDRVLVTMDLKEQLILVRVLRATQKQEDVPNKLIKNFHLIMKVIEH